MEQVAYTISVRLRVGVDSGGLRRVVAEADGRVTHWSLDGGWVAAIVADRSAAKDLAWQLLLHPDSESVSVRTELYDPEAVPRG